MVAHTLPTSSLHILALFLYNLIAMDRDAEPEYLPPDWPLVARHYWGYVTPAQPVAGDVQFFSETRPLIYDIHANLEVGIVTAGQQERIFSDLLLTTGAGDVWLTAAWEPHGCRITRSETRTVLVGFSPEFLGEESLAGVPWLALFAVPASQRPQVRTERMRERVLAIAAELQEELETRGPGWEGAVRYNLLHLLLVLRREWEPPASRLSASRAPTGDLMRLMPAMASLHADPKGRLGLEEAAAHCGLSASRFAVLFRRTMGMSFGQFTLRARMAQAAQQLAATDQSIEGIAAQLGFSSGSHLHRLFLKYYHTTPAAYRSQEQ